jgi:hypothetical protein
MSLIFCPECGHEISADAVACPSCGRPVGAVPVVERKVVVAQPRTESGFPTWAFIPIGLLAVILLFVVYLAFRGGDESANTNVNVNLAGRRTTQVPASDSPTSVSVPPTTDTQTVTVPGQTTTVAGTSTAPVAPPSDKGRVVINAKIVPSRGPAQSARNATFYLLDDDLETILSEARLEPIEGNTLTGSLGLATVYPDRYGDFLRSAMRAIANNAKYSGTTDGSGAASVAGVSPDQYYLFGITKVGRGFALWNSPVAVVGGDNVLNLSPQRVTEIPES